MYQLILESLLGLRLEADKLHFAPCVPAHWKSFQVHYRYRETLYRITVLLTSVAGAGSRLAVDGVDQAGAVVHLVDDHRQHSVEVRIGREEKRVTTSPR